MASERRAAHPSVLPYMVVAENDQGNPPHIRFFGTEKLAIDYASNSAYNNREAYLVFRTGVIATAHPQPAVVKRSPEGKPETR